VLTAVDHYTRSFARLSDGLVAADWAPDLDPAVERIRANIAALGDLLRPDDTGEAEIRSAEELVDAAEATAAACTEHEVRTEMLTAVRMLRRIDQVVVRFGDDVAPAQEPEPSRG
jgi:hypothetical protein